MTHVPGRLLKALNKLIAHKSDATGVSNNIRQQTPSPYNPYDQLLYHMQRKSVATILDIGANSGQFALKLLERDPTISIVSFEPLEEAHNKLLSKAASYPSWKVFRRCALGSENRTGVLNVAANQGQSSSLKEINPQFLEHAPHAEYIAKESVEIVTLDSIATSLDLEDSRIALKLDVQGLEREILQGAKTLLSHVDIILTEMALMESYIGQDLLIEHYQYLEELGFECYALCPAYCSDKFRMLEVDGLFVRP